MFALFSATETRRGKFENKKKGSKDESTAQDPVCLSFMPLSDACLAAQAKLLAPIPTPSDSLSVSSSAFWLRPLR